MKHDLLFKSCKIDSIKNENDRLTISGWGAVFNNIDAGDDMIKMGAFSKTISERKDRIAFCYSHEIDEPIAKITVLEERPEGLWFEAVLSASEEDLATKVKEGILKEFSIGYLTIANHTEQIDGKQVNVLTEIMLYEISLVTIAMNESAVLVGMKSDEQKNVINDRFERLITGERSQTKKYELMKLKATIQALIEAQPDKTTVQKKEPLSSINLESNLFTQNLQFSL